MNVSVIDILTKEEGTLKLLFIKGAPQHEILEKGGVLGQNCLVVHQPLPINHQNKLT